jgi:hypothetical protein
VKSPIRIRIKTVWIRSTANTPNEQYEENDGLVETGKKFIYTHSASIAINFVE